jgi:arylsulfatase A-like enzyme
MRKQRIARHQHVGPMIVSLVAAASALLLAMTSPPALAAEGQQRPNILYIMSDDHASAAVSAYGGILAQVAPTPNIDRIAKGGMRLENCFVTNSICTPSRGCILTGQYSHVNGVGDHQEQDWGNPYALQGQ